MATWKRGGDVALSLKFAPFVAKSWRCCAECRQEVSHEDFRRIENGRLLGVPPRHIVFMVLTIDRNGYFGGKPWKNLASAFKDITKNTQRFRRRLARMLGVDRIEYVGVVESQKKGWPHMNLLIVSPELAEEVAAMHAQNIAEGVPKDDEHLVRGEILRHARQCRWGRTTAEVARDSGKVASYITKVAGRAEAAMGELAKHTQLPLDSRPHFRRLRQSRGFLATRWKGDGTTTGVLLDGERSIHAFRKRLGPEEAWTPEAQARTREINEVIRDHRGRGAGGGVPSASSGS